MKTEEFDLSELWEVFKDINKDATAIENFEDALKEFITLIEVKVFMDWKGQNEFIDWLKIKAGKKLSGERK